MATNYWRGTTSTNWRTNTNWSLGHYPTASEPAAFDASSPNPSTIDIASTAATCAGIDFTTAPGGVTWSGTSSVSFHGNIKLKSGMTLTYSSTLTLDTTASITSSGVAFAGPFLINAPGLIVQILDDFTTPLTLMLTAGNFVDNNHAVNIGIFSSSNTNTRTLTKTGTWTISSATATSWNCATSTNFTLSDTAGSIVITDPNNHTFAGGGVAGELSYYDLNFAPITVGKILTISGSNTVTTLQTNNGSVLRNTIKFTDSTTTTVTTLSIDGANVTYPTIITGTSTGGWAIKKVSGTISLNNVSVAYSTASGGATFNALTSNGCVDGGGNSGWKFGTDVTISITGIAATMAAGTEITSGEAIREQTGISLTAATGTSITSGRASIPASGIIDSSAMGNIIFLSNVAIPTTGISVIAAITNSIILGDSVFVASGISGASMIADSIIIGESLIITMGIPSSGIIGDVIVTAIIAGADVSIGVTGIELTGTMGTAIIEGQSLAVLTGIDLVGTTGAVIIAASSKVLVMGIDSAGIIGDQMISGAALFSATGIDSAVNIGDQIIEGNAVFISTGAEGVSDTGILTIIAGAIAVVKKFATIRRKKRKELPLIINTMMPVWGSEAVTLTGLIRPRGNSTAKIYNIEAYTRLGRVQIETIDNYFDDDEEIAVALLAAIGGIENASRYN